MTGAGRAACLLAVLACLAACRDDNLDRQPRLEPYGTAAALPGGMAAQLPPAHTVPREPPQGTALEGAALLARGRDRFAIFCQPCHGAAGSGDGPVVASGFPRPPDFHDERLLAAPAAHFLRVIADGHGAMYPYGARVPPADRRAITAFARALQLAGPPAAGGDGAAGR